MRRSEELGALAPEQNGSRKGKTLDTQSLNTELLYNLVRLKRVPETSIFTDLVSNYNILVHSIDSLSL